jgi:hypothetical protein
MPASHCADVGTFASYWKVCMPGTGRKLAPGFRFWNWPVRRSTAVAIGGLPGIENTVLPSGRS